MNALITHGTNQTVVHYLLAVRLCFIIHIFVMRNFQKWKI